MENEVVVSGEPAVVETGNEPAIQDEPVANEPVVEDAPAADPEPEPKKKTAQERIDEMRRKQGDAEREAAYWRKVALEKEQKPAELPPTERLPVPPRPKLEQFETTEAYEDALLGWHEQRKEVETSVARQRTEQEQALTQFNKRAADLRKEHEDYDEVIEAPVFSQAMRGVILHSENGPAIAYHLGLPENRDLADRIRSLPDGMQPYEIGKLETQILLAKQTKKVTSAPAPIKPVGMGGGDAGPVDESKMADADWYEHYKKQKQQRLAKKYGG